MNEKHFLYSECPNKKPLVATWGGISLVHKRKAVIEDIPYKVYGGRTELVKRLLAEILTQLSKLS